MMKWYIWNESYMNCGYEIKSSYDLCSYERNSCNCVVAIPERRSNQLSYEATDVGSWSFVASNGPVRNKSMMKWYIWNESYMNCGYEIKWSYDLRSYERNFCNCEEKSEKFRTLTGFEPVTSRFRCDALTNWAMKPMTLGAGHLWVLMVPWGMNQWWNGIYEMNHIWTADFISAVHI